MIYLFHKMRQNFFFLFIIICSNIKFCGLLTFCRQFSLEIISRIFIILERIVLKKLCDVYG